MAPMIDIIFLLLIFFLVAAKWRPQEDFLAMQLPAAVVPGGRLGEPEPLSIRIFATQSGCDVQIGQSEAISVESGTVEANLAVVIAKIERCLRTEKRLSTDPVEIICEPQVKWDHLAKIYNALTGMGLTNVTFVMTQ